MLLKALFNLEGLIFICIFISGLFVVVKVAFLFSLSKDKTKDSMHYMYSGNVMKTLIRGEALLGERSDLYRKYKKNLVTALIWLGVFILLFILNFILMLVVNAKTG